MKLIMGSEQLRFDKKGLTKFGSCLFIILSIIALFYAIPRVFSLEEEETTYGTANITKALAITMSTNLTAGINFGTVTVNTNNNNATGNMNSSTPGSCAGESCSEFNVTIDSTTNLGVIVCLNVSGSMTTGTYNIPLTGFTWSNSSTNAPDEPLNISTVALTTTFQNTTLTDVMSGTSFFRFNLDVPSGTAGGDYQNTVYFRGIENTTAGIC